jgi:hypothetical protein
MPSLVIAYMLYINELCWFQQSCATPCNLPKNRLKIRRPLPVVGVQVRYCFPFASCLQARPPTISPRSPPHARRTASPTKRPGAPIPVHLRGVITYFDPDYGTGMSAIFIHDATGGIFVKQTSKLSEQALRRSPGGRARCQRPWRLRSHRRQPADSRPRPRSSPPEPAARQPCHSQDRRLRRPVGGGRGLHPSRHRISPQRTLLLEMLDGPFP